MKRTICSGLLLLLCLASVLPAFAQGGENNAWQAIGDERDTRRRAERLDDFIRTYQNSSHRPDADKMLINIWRDSGEYSKIAQHAEGFRTNLPSADAPSKSIVFTEAMMAWANLKNTAKVVEFSGYALTADPNNLTVLILLAGSNLPDPKKAMEYAQKATTVSRPANVAEPQYQNLQFRAQSIFGNFLFAENKFKEANEAYAVALKINPRDHATQFRSGFASLNLAVLAAQAAQTANTQMAEASKAGAAATAAEYTEKQQAAEKEALTHRDAAMDSLARAMAIGGQFAAQAKQLFDNTYQSKNKSLEGADQFVAQKKVELGL